ncbi:hypothetical protein GGE24_002625 [Bradyrhizobium centrosematis]|nr:hypothetical protein [Bradyrhizobium centrosematis]MCS3773313.1 hypothetical protein [Bradyrhizobium centrosematis]
MGADDIGAKGFCRAGNREQSRRAHDRCDQRTAKSCGPGARSLASSLVVMCGPTGPHISHPQGDGAIVQRSRGERDISRSNHCAGKAGMSPVALFSAMQQHTQSAFGMAVHGSQPAPGLPCALVRSRARQRSQKLGRDAPRGRGPMSVVPCQSFTTALAPRTQRSVPSTMRCRAGAQVAAGRAAC